MTQIASLLAVATVFIGLWTRIIYILHLGREGLIYTRDKTTKQKVQGGLMHTQCLADHFCCKQWGSFWLTLINSNLLELLPLICCVEKFGFKPFTSLIKTSRIT